MKLRYFFLIICSIYVLFSLIEIAIISYPTVEKALINEKMGKRTYSTPISTIDKGNFQVVFYYNVENGVSVAVLKKGLFGWRMVSDGDNFKLEDAPSGLGSIGLHHDKSVIYGLIDMTDISKITTNGSSAYLIDLKDNIKLWYHIDFDKQNTDSVLIDVYNQEGQIVTSDTINY